MSENSMNLVNQVLDAKEKVQVERFTYDLDWIVSKIKSGQVKIQPAYQRTFEWTIAQQSRFIESLILNLPVPPIYLAENDKGEWELLDGLQRISTFLHFIGEIHLLNAIESSQLYREESDLEEFIESDDLDEDLENISENIPKLPSHLTLKGCDIIPDLNGKDKSSLDAPLYKRLLNKAIDIYVFSYTGRDNAWMRYHMFIRINSGGTNLSAQQIRNASIRLLDNKVIDLINEELAIDQDFKQTLKLFKRKYTVNQNRRMILEDLVLRFFAFKNNKNAYKKDLKPFLDEYLEHCGLGKTEFNIDKERSIFKRTFSFLASKCNEDSFKIDDKKKSLYLYEVFTLIIAKCLEQDLDLSKLNSESINSFIKSTYFDKGDFIGGGRNTEIYLNKRLDKLTNYLKSLGINIKS
jgi:hypothetical protein